MARTLIGQGEHDRIVQKSAQDYLSQRYQVKTNPGSAKNFPIQGVYPDVIVWETSLGSTAEENVSIIEEIETNDTVTDEHAEQWVTYSNLEIPVFKLIIPKESVMKAAKIIADNKIAVDSLQSYEIMAGGAVRFEDVI